MGTIRRQWRKGWLLVMVAVLVHFPTGRSADALNISMDAIPSLRLEQGWDSNIFNTETNETSDFYFRVVPALALRWNTPGAGVRLTGSFEGTWYYDHPEVNEEPTWYVTLGLTGGDAIQITSTVSLVPTVFYLNSYNSSRRTELLPSTDPVLPSSSINTYTNTRSQDFGGGLALNYQATQRLSFRLSGYYSERDFSSDAPGGLSDSSAAGAGAVANYLFTPHFSSGLGITWSHDSFETGVDSNVLSAVIPFGYQIGPPVRIDGDFGVSRALQQGGLGGSDLKDFAPTWKVNMTYVSAPITVSVYGSAGYTGNSGYAGITRRWNAGMMVADQLSSNWYWGLGGRYEFNRSVFVTDAVDLSTVSATTSLRYTPLSWAGVDLTGNYIRQWSDGDLGIPMTEYSALLGITIYNTYKIF